LENGPPPGRQGSECKENKNVGASLFFKKYRPRGIGAPGNIFPHLPIEIQDIFRPIVFLEWEKTVLYWLQHIV